MALRYWVGGSGTWNTSSTTNWSATSGGAGGASAPTSADDVIFNSASSGVSYVVTCAGGVCKSITTSAPATGTLSFNDPSFLSFFTVYSGDINIHAACLFTSTGTITHIPATNGTYTTTFNGSGTNTSNVSYAFSSASTGVSLNFCNSTTSSFTLVQIGVRGAFTCTNAAITVVGSSQSSRFGYANSTTSASSVTMTGTTINAGTASIQVGSVYIGGAETTSWAISTLNINVRNVVSSFGDGLYVGQGASTQPSAMGAVTFTDCFTFSGTYNAFFTRATSVTLTTSGINLISNLTTTGALVINTGCTLANLGFTASIGGTTTLAGTGYYTSSASAATTFVGAVTVADGGFTNEGSLTFSAGVTFTPTGSNTALLLADTVVADAITATNTLMRATSITVNGGVGKAFSYTINASAASSILGTYPTIVFTSMAISTPACSIVGVPSKRVIVNFPLVAGNPSLRSLSITGSTPTLTDVSFFGTTINGGASNFSGTRLGTDGLSSGFLPQTPATKFLVLPSSSTFVWNTASIWALTSGGATSANNIPLPQDTVQIDGNTGGAGSVITCDENVYIKTLNRASAVSAYAFTLNNGLYLFGDLLADISGATLTISSGIRPVRSGDTNRYFRTSSTAVDFSASNIAFDIGTATTMNIGGSVSPNFNINQGIDFTSGNFVIDSGTSFGPTGLLYTSTFQVRADATISGGGWTATTSYFSALSGATITSSNYTVNLHDASSSTGATYSNAATTTAKNGSIVTRALPASILTDSSTATNPFVSIRIENALRSTTSQLQPSGYLYLQALTNAAPTNNVLFSGFGSAIVIKTNGGTVNFQKGSGTLNIQYVDAPQPNTFYTNGTLFASTGWNSGSPPASPPSGNFLIF